jgi:hypothetical protein
LTYFHGVGVWIVEPLASQVELLFAPFDMTMMLFVESYTGIPIARP